MTVVNQQQTNDNETIDLGELFQTVLRNWKLIVICVFAAILFAILYLRITQPIYAVDGLVQIDSNQSSTDVLLGGSGLASLANTKSPADTEVQLLKSRFVLGQVVRNLSLDIILSSGQDRWYRRLIHPGKEEDIVYTKNGVRYSANGASFRVVKFNVPYGLLDRPFKLHFLPNGQFTIGSISESEGHKQLKGRIGQLLIQKIGGETLELLIQQDGSTLPSNAIFITQRSPLQAVQDINNNLLIAEKGKQTGVISLVYQGKDQDKIVQTLDEVMRVYLAQNIASRTEETQNTLGFLEKQLPELRSQLEASENLYNKFREKNNTIDPTKEAELLLQQSVDLKTKKIELEQQSVLLSQKYTSNFPLIAQVKAQIASLDQDSKDLESRVVAMPELQRRYLQLYRDVQVNTVLYTSLLNSYQQLKVLKAGKVATVRVLDGAIKSANPIKPQKLLVLLLSVVIGLIVSMMLIVIKSIFYSGIKDLDVIEAKTGVSVIATVPRSVSQQKMFIGKKSKGSLLARDDSEDLAVESLRSLRTQIHFSAAKAYNNIILITGPSPEIGKSFISANFAAVFAQMGKSIVLVDADMRRGHMSKYFNIEKPRGLSDYLINDKMDLSEVCHNTFIPGLDFISKGNTPSNPAELLLSENFQKLMDDLSANYDYVIIDSPPILAATDGAIIARSSGMTLVVARHSQTHIRELELTLSRLAQAGATVQGIVFNDVPGASGYGYGYQYAYNYRSHK
ncbi:MAG: polysaccharide biosynthesis tyrosine autokinase [Candidatus Saccharibacteria bacterium]|nr:polysaccharide biosynthesis tyrosine autokinase [Moraxellaceae bacterium]